MTDFTAFYIFLGVLVILAIVGIVFASHVSILWAATVFLGIALVIITGASVLFEDLRDHIEEAIEKVNFIGMLRRKLVEKINFSISEKIQRIVILIMSAASVALIVWAIIIVAMAIKGESSDTSWAIDLIGEVPVLHVLRLITQAYQTEFKPDFFVTVLLLSLIVMAIAAAVVQIIMTLVNKLIEEAKDESKLFGFLGGFSVTVLTASGTLFISSLLSPLLDFSKPWGWFEKLCKPIFTTSFGKFLLQVLVAAIMFALLVFLCFDWVKDIVLGVAGIALSLIVAFIFSFFNNGAGSPIMNNFLILLYFLYPITDIIKSFILKEDKFEWVPVVVPLVLSAIVTTVSMIIDKDHILNLNQYPILAFIGITFYVIYLLAKPGISIIKQDRDDTGSAAAPEVGQSES